LVFAIESDGVMGEVGGEAE